MTDPTGAGDLEPEEVTRPTDDRLEIGDGAETTDVDGATEVEADLVDDATLAQMTFELRTQITDRVVGIVDDDVWDDMVGSVLDEFWPEDG